jgi:WD40 repeat protein
MMRQKEGLYWAYRELGFIQFPVWFFKGVDFSKNDQWLASCNRDETTRLWDVSTSALVAVFTGHNDVARCIAFSPDSLQIASGGDDIKVRIWEVGSSWSSLDLRDGGDYVEQLTYLRDGQTLLSC